jgi:ribosome-associated protein
LDLGPGATLCRYLIIVSFETTVQVVSLAREMEQEIESRLSRKCLGMEGKQDGGWVLLDYGDVVINVMEQRRRDLYRLEELWQQASELELI